MDDLDTETVLRVGGWDARFARVRAVATLGDHAAAVIDSNGDGADINLEHYQRVDGQWECGSSSGGAGDWGRGWSEGVWAEHDRDDERGWWLILWPGDDPDDEPQPPSNEGSWVQEWPGS